MTRQAHVGIAPIAVTTIAKLGDEAFDSGGAMLNVLKRNRMIQFTYPQIRPMIGLGGFGFMTGVFMGVTFTAEVGKQASQAMADYHVANGSATIDSGVGYKVPAAFAKLINGVLSIFTKYRMDRQETLIPGWGGLLFNRYENIPAGCSPAGAATATTT